jgi:hypothetical protein
MDAGIIIKPVAGIVVAENVGPAAAAGHDAAPTDLPAAKAVNPSPDPTPTHNDTPRPGTSPAYITHNFVIDPQSQEVIYRVMDSRTRQVLWQVPDALLLRNRAYAQTLASGSRPAAGTGRTEIKE